MAAKLKLTKEQEALFNAMTSKLQQECALVYIANGYENKTQSYITACKNLKKKPSKNPDTSGSEILNYPSVTAFIDSVRVKAAESANTDAKWLLERLREVDDLDILDIMTDDLSGFKSLKEWPKVWRTNISGIDISTMMGNDDIETVIKKIKWPDKVKNRELIGRHVNVKAWDKEEKAVTVVSNIMPVPTAGSTEEWEEAAKAQQEQALSYD